MKIKRENKRTEDDNSVVASDVNEDDDVVALPVPKQNLGPIKRTSGMVSLPNILEIACKDIFIREKVHAKY